MATKESVLKLMADKDEVEAKIKEFGAVLEANDNIGMHGELVDAQGFPRNDIDVYQVRSARNQIICLQNDHKRLMKEIELSLHKIHAASATEPTHIVKGVSEIAITSNSPSHLPRKAFAKIDLVAGNSPAEEAGCKTGDLVIEFGTINYDNFTNLTQIATIVRHMQNQKIPLKVTRGENVFEITLTPKAWSGRGLLGCNIVLPE